MQRVRQLLVVALVAAGLATVAPTSPVADAAGTPPLCPSNIWGGTGVGWQRVCDRYTTTGPLGSIGILGDSVLLGSSNVASTPGLPQMLSDKGWGPINLVATLGMKTRWTMDDNLSSVFWLQRWHTFGFHPDVIAVNLGANHLGTCTPGNTAPCKTQILYVLNEIALHHPNARIWWAKINHQPFGGAYSSAMVGWNQALDELAATRPNMVVWDWPAALLTANPAITMDMHRVHPVSATQYVKRSTLMATHITDMMGKARFTGPAVTVPSVTAGAYLRQHVTPVVAAEYDATKGSTTPVDVSASVPDGAHAVDLMLFAQAGGTSGWLTVFPCGETQPVVSSLNYAAGATRVSHAIVRLNADEDFCIYSSEAAHVVAGLLAWYGDSADAGLTPIAPLRPLDTRPNSKASEFEVDVPDGDAVAITVTVTGASSGGMILAVPCAGEGLDIPVLAYEANEVVAGATFAPETDGSNICLDVQPNDEAQLPHVIVDVNGVFSLTGPLGFVPTTATRLLDTRSAVGGWVGRHGVAQTIDIPAAPAGAQAVTGTLTIVKPSFQSWLTAYKCGESLPPSSSVNARAGLVLANSLTMGVRAADGDLCIWASGSTHTLFDVVGWWVELS